MWYLVIAVILLCVAIFAGCSDNKNNQSSRAGNQPPILAQVFPEEKVVLLSKAEIEKKLAELATKPGPKELTRGAMCYKVAGPPEHAEYVCPKCNEKTLYSNWNTHAVTRDIPSCRRLVQNVQKMKKIKIELDESQFCKKCSPKEQSPTLCAWIEYQGGEKHKVESVDSMDFILLQEFLQGEIVHKGKTDDKSPLKDYIPRLKKLLNVK